MSAMNDPNSLDSFVDFLVRNDMLTEDNVDVELCGLCHFYDYCDGVCKLSGLFVDDSHPVCGDYVYWLDLFVCEVSE